MPPKLDPHPKTALHFAGFFLGAVALGACVQIVGMDDPVLVDHLDEPSGTAGASTSGGASSSSSSSSSGSDTSSSSGSSSSSSSGGSLAWADWPMPNPPSMALPNPASYNVGSTQGVVTDQVTNLMWMRTLDAVMLRWTEAQAYCDGLVLDGYSDWRLPTRIELVSLVDFTKTNPAIDTAAFPNTPAAVFWTNSMKMSSKTTWVVDFTDGSTSSVDAGTAHRVRCVR